MAGKMQPSDSRHHTLLCEIDTLYRKANGGLPMPSPGRAAKALKLFLDENPKWPAGTLIVCVRNRFASTAQNLSEPPHVWIASLPRFFRGPVDEWGRAIKTSATEVKGWGETLEQMK